MAAIRHAAAGPPTVAKGDRVIRVAIGDHNAGYALALTSLIDDEPGLEVVGHASDVQSLVPLIMREGAAVAVVAIRLAGGGVLAVADQFEQRNMLCRLVTVTSVATATAKSMAAAAGATLVPRGDGRLLLSAVTGEAE